jgi:hypothetical protein
MTLPKLGLLPAPSTGPKILVFDIETAPYLSWTWGLWQTNVLDIAQEWYLLSFAYAWYDIETQSIGQVDWVGLPSNRKWKGGSDDDKYVASRLWELLHAADIVVGQNSDRFDIRKANERFLIHGFQPPAPYPTVDTQKVYNRNFSGSASLKYMARKTDVTRKESNRGLALWLECMAGDKEAWKEMEEYNRVDVISTSEVYTKLIPWMQLGQPGHPNLGHYVEADGYVCPACGNKEKDEGGKGFTTTQRPTATRRCGASSVAGIPRAGSPSHSPAPSCDEHGGCYLSVVRARYTDAHLHGPQGLHLDLLRVSIVRPLVDHTPLPPAKENSVAEVLGLVRDRGIAPR